MDIVGGVYGVLIVQLSKNGILTYVTPILRAAVELRKC
jgi:hypothetical protein